MSELQQEASRRWRRFSEDFKRDGGGKGVRTILNRSDPFFVNLAEGAIQFEGAGFSGGFLNCPAYESSGSWTSSRSQYWRNRAAGATEGEFSAEQLARMQQGKGPLHPELGVPMELHHIIPVREGGTHNPANLQEVWPWEHANIDPHRYYNGPRPPRE